MATMNGKSMQNTLKVGKPEVEENEMSLDYLINN